MRRRSPYRLAAIVAAVALLATACGGGEDPEDSEEPEGVAGGELRVYNAEPASLVPMAANDQPSLRGIRQLYRGLVAHDNDGTPVNDLAESIESEDNRLWTITLKDGFTFTNGEPVDADAFLRAWNDAAYGPNARNNNYFFGRIAGHDQMQGEEPEAETLSGLTKVDDLTFTVELSEPFSGFPAVVGYPGFFPVAQACLDDFDACNEAPISNGPYQIEGDWERDVQITLVRNDDFAGDPGMADSIIFRLYEDDQTAYADFQAGELDIMENIPPARYQEALATYGDRIFEQPNNTLSFVG
jgi:ABC-type transport system substrate-binding protein